MDLKKVMKWLKISFVFIILLIGIFLSFLIMQFPYAKTDIFSRLGIIPWEDKCSGELIMFTSGSNECNVEAKIIAENCDGRKYQIKENTCYGRVLCQDTITYDSFQASCAWTVNSGNYRYALCIGNKQKNSGIVSCK